MRLLLAEDEHSISINLKNIMKVDDETAVSYADSVWNTGKTTGFLDGYRYLRADAQGQDGELLIFLDCEQKRFITDAGHKLKTPLTIISADA